MCAWCSTISHSTAQSDVSIQCSLMMVAGKMQTRHFSLISSIRAASKFTALPWCCSAAVHLMVHCSAESAVERAGKGQHQDLDVTSSLLENTNISLSNSIQAWVSKLRTSEAWCGLIPIIHSINRSGRFKYIYVVLNRLSWLSAGVISAEWRRGQLRTHPAPSFWPRHLASSLLVTGHWQIACPHHKHPPLLRSENFIFLISAAREFTAS